MSADQSNQKYAQIHKICQHYPFEQTIGMIADGRITDALTVLSLQKAWFYLFGMPKMR